MPTAVIQGRGESTGNQLSATSAYFQDILVYFWDAQVEHLSNAVPQLGGWVWQVKFPKTLQSRNSPSPESHASKNHSIILGSYTPEEMKCPSTGMSLPINSGVTQHSNSCYSQRHFSSPHPFSAIPVLHKSKPNCIMHGPSIGPEPQNAAWISL